jgi:hypothetical protein
MRLLLVLWIWCGMFAAPAFAEKRVALIIGATSYREVGSLPQATMDARIIHDALTQLGGFSHLPPVLVDPTKAELEAALKSFALEARNADVAVFYFSGHGMQHEDDNWLIPVDASLQNETDVLYEGVRLSTLHQSMRQAKLRIIILDACRNNPFALSWATTKAAGDGLARINNLPLGSVLAYAAAPGKKTPDNGVYARSLARHMVSEGLELRQVFERVYEDVAAAVPGAEPMLEASYQGSFSFTGGMAAGAAAGALDAETASWIAATTRNDLKVDLDQSLTAVQCDRIRSHEAAYPKGRFSGLAGLLLARCEGAASLPATPSAPSAGAVTLPAPAVPGAWVAAAAGFDPRPVLSGLIYAFQNCGPAQAYLVLAPDVYNTIYAQTSGMGCYAPIQAAGPVRSIDLVSAYDSPLGPMYRVRVSHDFLQSDWILAFDKGYSRVTGLTPLNVGTIWYGPDGRPLMLPNGNFF